MKRASDGPFLDPEELIEAGMRMYDAGGLPKGQSTGWRSLDDLYTVLPGQWTVVTGMPGMGKSEWLDAMLMNLVEGDPLWRFFLYSPENYPPETHLVKLVEKRVRKPFGAGPTDRMTMREYLDASVWTNLKFLWLDPDLKTPDELIRMSLEHQQEGGKIGVVLDPWNTLEHQCGSMSETDYVSFILTEVTKLARSANAHVWLVVHPQKMQRNKDGSRPVPTPYDISGSAHWYNKADNIICVHRDQSEGGQDVDVIVQKVRFKHVGHPGMVTLKYDKVTGRYFEAPTIMDPITGKPEQYRAP